jgi:hypothetical protein
MDLTTVSRKVKAHQYSSSKEFTDDMYLIYSNCFEYNTDPKSIYRYHAQKMKERTDQLLVDFPIYSKISESTTLETPFLLSEPSSIEGKIHDFFKMRYSHLNFTFSNYRNRKGR